MEKSHFRWTTFRGAGHNLMTAGAITVFGIHHSPKEFRKAKLMYLENIMRGTGDFGAMVGTAWGVRQIDADANRIYVENVKPREFVPPKPFILEGRPYIDQEGDFRVCSKPGETRPMEEYVNQPFDPRKAKAFAMFKEHKTVREVKAELRIGGDTEKKWRQEWAEQQEQGEFDL